MFIVSETVVGVHRPARAAFQSEDRYVSDLIALSCAAVRHTEPTVACSRSGSLELGHGAFRFLVTGLGLGRRWRHSA
jgi:hypothetical protein